jgi:hypothetical protein
MDPTIEKRFESIPEAIEHVWLRYEAALNLLEVNGVKDPLEYILNYAEQPANKARAHERFLEVTALLKLYVRDSQALELLSKALQRGVAPS